MTEENGGPDESYYERHPFFKDQSLIVTDQVEAVYNTVEEGLIFRNTGVSYSKDPRGGKTKIILAVRAALNLYKPRVATYVLSANGNEKNVQSQLAQFGDVLSCMGHPGVMIRRTEDRKAAAKARLQTDCNKRNGDQVVFFIDEGQNWLDEYWSYWKDFVNSIARDEDHPIHIFTCTFAQSEILSLIERTKVGRKDIFKRFFLQHIELAGIQTKDQLGAVFSQFDDPSSLVFPGESGICYSAYFLPKAYSSGWRLFYELDSAWAAIGPDSGKYVKPEIGMGSVVLALKLFFLGRIAYDSDTFTGRAIGPWESVADSRLFKDLQQ